MKIHKLFKIHQFFILLIRKKIRKRMSTLQIKLCSLTLRALSIPGIEYTYARRVHSLIFSTCQLILNTFLCDALWNFTMLIV